MKNELAFHNHKNALEVAQKLIEENYVVMISREEDLIILNYEWAPCGNRNYVVFGNADNYYEIEKGEDE